MATDNYAKLRSKRKFVFEFKYTPIIGAFDQRGMILQLLHEKFKAKLPHWRVANVEIQLLDNTEKASKIISVDHQVGRIIYEDCGTLQEFNDDVRKFLDVFIEIYRKESLSISRAGVRFQSVFETPNLKSFDEIVGRLKKVLLNHEFPLSIKLKDFQFIFNHDFGTILIGPVRKNELWVRENFLFPDKFDLEYGLALDIDSYSTNLELNELNDLKNVFITVQQLTLATEKEILTPFLSQDN